MTSRPSKSFVPGQRYDCVSVDCDQSFVFYNRRLTQFCKRCAIRAVKQDPEYRARCADRQHRLWSDPAYRNAMIVKQRIVGREAMRDPAKLARRVEVGRKNGLRAVAHIVTPAGHPARIKAGKTRTLKALAWCPPGYRDEYKRLVDVNSLKAPVAREMILRDIRLAASRLKRGALDPAVRQKVLEAAVYLGLINIVDTAANSKEVSNGRP